VFLEKTWQAGSLNSILTDPVEVHVTLIEDDGSAIHVLVTYVITDARLAAWQPGAVYDLSVSPLVIVFAGAVPVKVVTTKSDGLVGLNEQGEADVHGFVPLLPANSA